MKKQKTKKLIRNSEYDFYLFRNMDIRIEKIQRKGIRNNPGRKKMDKKIDLRYLIDDRTTDLRDYQASYSIKKN